MQDFIDLRGASGAAYRFRRWTDGEGSSPVAGNYAVLRPQGDGFKLLFTATTNDLSRPPGTVKAAINKVDGVQVYARLNVSRSVREAEDIDISTFYGATSSAQAKPVPSA